MSIKILSLMKIELGQIEHVTETLKTIPEVREIFAITGAYDLAVIFEAESGDQFHRLYATQIDQMDGLSESNSLLIMKHEKLAG